MGGDEYIGDNPVAVLGAIDVNGIAPGGCLSPNATPDTTGAAPISLPVLLQEAQKGDREAFRHFVEATYGSVLTYVRRYGALEWDCEDVVQEVFLAVFRHLDSFDATRSVEPWLFTITRNVVRRRAGRLRRWAWVQRLGREAKPTLPEPITGQAASLDAAIDARDTLRFLHKELSKLPSEQRDVIALTATSTLTLSQIADILQIPESTVKTHLYRGRNALAKSLARRRAKEVML